MVATSSAVLCVFVGVAGIGSSSLNSFELSRLMMGFAAGKGGAAKRVQQ